MVTGQASAHDLPARIGRHEVLGYIATGGMAELFLGRDPHTGRPVVIKRILPHLARQSSFVSMFVDEARIGSMIRHPNLVEIYELGQVGADLFLVMEYLAGENLSGLIRRLVARNEAISYPLAAHIVAEACVGLHAAHTLADDNGKPLHVVHRDVSPSNIFVTYGGVVKVLDFGIATAAHRLTQTATGQLKGKVMYMSPEQCRGEMLDRRSDIFSLGIVLYELSMQRRLFKRPNELMVLKAVCDDAIPRPMRERRDYPAVLEAICMRALARRKEDRYESAWQMHEDLRDAQRMLGGGHQDTRLEAEITRLFAERVIEKRQVLANLRAGTDFGPLPAAEVDEGVDVPQVSLASHSVRASSDDPTRSDVVPVTRRWGLVLVLLFIGAAGGGGWWWWQQQEDDTTPAVASAPAATPTTAAPAEPPAPDVKPVAVAHVVFTIDTEPSGATVIVDGEVKGTTPLELERPRGDAKVHIEIRFAGYQPLAQDLKPDRDQRLVLALA